MKYVRYVGVLVAATLMMSVVGVASAAAHEFLAEKNAVGKTLKAEALETQVFRIEGAKAEPRVECKKLSVASGTVVAEKAETQQVTIKYEECTGHDFGLSAAAEISPANYTFNANGKVVIKETITIKTALGNQEVPSQEVGTVTYTPEERNGNQGIKITPNVTGIASKGAFGNSITGTYTGASFTWVGPRSTEEGISWK